MAPFGHFVRQRSRISSTAGQILAANRFTTLQVVLEAKEPCSAESVADSLTPALQDLLAVCQESALISIAIIHFSLVAPPAQTLVVLLPRRATAMDESWRQAVGDYATLVWVAGKSVTGDDASTTMSTSGIPAHPLRRPLLVGS